MTLAIFTSVAANYIPKARVLARSAKRYAPDATFYLMLTDKVPAQFSLADEPFDALITPDMLGIDRVGAWLFGHRLVEACTAVKPFALQYLLEKTQAERVVYFDPDIVLFSPLDELLTEFERSSVLLTPHICEPEQGLEAIKDNEINSLKHGLYNLGFVGVKNDAVGRAYAAWWAERCLRWCHDDIPGGLFTDQKWNDHVPIFFDRVGVLKDPGYNVATWNYAQRRIEGSFERGFTVNGRPLVFHHFTGYDSGAHHLMLDKYGRDMPAAGVLSRWYEDECRRAEQEALSRIPWAYGSYASGEKVRDAHRQLYRSRADLQEAFADPFATTPGGPYRSSYAQWLRDQKLWDAEMSRSGAPIPFSRFLQETRDRLAHYVVHTHRLSAWQKRAAGRIISAVFGLLALPFRRNGSGAA